MKEIKTNLINKSSVKKNFTKIPNEQMTNFDISDRAYRIYNYLLSLDTKKAYITNKILAKIFNVSVSSIEKAIKQLRDSKLIEVKPKGKNDYIYIINKYKQDINDDINEDIKDVNEDINEDKQDENKDINEDIKDVFKMYSDVCKSYSQDNKYTDTNIMQVKKLLENYTKEDIRDVFLKLEKDENRKAQTYKNTFSWITKQKNFINVKNAGIERKKNKKNRFNNFSQRNYSKEEIEELEKSFFNIDSNDMHDNTDKNKKINLNFVLMFLNKYSDKFNIEKDTNVKIFPLIEKVNEHIKDKQNISDKEIKLYILRVLLDNAKNEDVKKIINQITTNVISGRSITESKKLLPSHA